MSDDHQPLPGEATVQQGHERRPRKSWGPKALIGLVAAFVLIQFVPVDRPNPPVQQEPDWDAPETKAFFDRACADCHSNETKWPWYSYVAPISWQISHTVEEGREHFNVSEWEAGTRTDEPREEYESGNMPVPQYPPFHPEARLTPAEREAFIAGLAATFEAPTGAEDGEEPPDPLHDSHDHDH